jgi:hypothetical protein
VTIQNNAFSHPFTVTSSIIPFCVREFCRQQTVPGILSPQPLLYFLFPFLIGSFSSFFSSWAFSFFGLSLFSFPFLVVSPFTTFPCLFPFHRLSPLSPPFSCLFPFHHLSLSFPLSPPFSCGFPFHHLSLVSPPSHTLTAHNNFAPSK